MLSTVSTAPTATTTLLSTTAVIAANAAQRSGLMHFRINANDINHGMSLVSRALPLRPTNPVFDGVYVETIDEGIQLTCTNGELTIKSIVPASVLEEGRSLLPAKLLGELARKLEGDLDVVVDERARAVIKGMGSNTTMMCLDAEGFPDIRDVEGENRCEFPQNSFREAIGRVIFAVSVDDSKKILTGCLMETYREETRLVCLDGFRLALQRIYVKHEVPEDRESISAVIPGSVIGEIGRMLSDNDEPVRLVVSASHMMAAFEQTKVYAPLIIGEYINYKQILPATWMTALRVNRHSFIGAIERAALMAREGKNNLLKLRIGEEGLFITANAERGAVLENLDIDFEGSPLEIAFNAKYLTDVIRTIDTTDISMRFNSNVSPCVICPVTGNQYTYLVLPVRVAD